MKESTASYLDNIGYLFGGYDIVQGSPNARGSVDPGFKSPKIFQTTYKRKSLTADLRYVVPDHAAVLRCIACSNDFKTTLINDTREYIKHVSNSVHANLRLWKASFHGSHEYKTAQKETHSLESLLIASKARCTVYCAGLDAFELPPFTPAFLKAVTE